MFYHIMTTCIVSFIIGSFLSGENKIEFKEFMKRRTKLVLHQKKPRKRMIINSLDNMDDFV